MYVVAGSKGDDVIQQIHTDLPRLFPGKAPPTFPDITEGAFVAYSYLEAAAEFLIPFLQNSAPLEFMDASGRKTFVRSFGIRSEDEFAYTMLRRQPRVLFRKGDGSSRDFEFAIDLCARSSPSQLIVARVKHKTTFADALVYIEKEEAEFGRLAQGDSDAALTAQEIGPNDVLLVPEMFWHISHRFSDIEGRVFCNPNLKGQRLSVAQQDIMFRLHRGGAEVRSEAKDYCTPISTEFILNRPFLVCMKMRDASRPYFMMWVDNAELLVPYRPQEEK
jgi:hypothetical protein